MKHALLFSLIVQGGATRALAKRADGYAADEALESRMLSRSFSDYEFVRQQE